MKGGSDYGHKGMAGAYGGAKATKTRSYQGRTAKNPLKGKSMPRGPKDPGPSHKGSR